MSSAPASGLADQDLIAAVACLARSEREATATMIGHLAELYARRLHVQAGYSSLFAYCTDVLGLSEGAAYDRMKAAQVACRYPPVLAMLEAGHLNLTTIRLLAPYLTPENQQSLLAEAVGLGKRAVQELLAWRFPQPDVPTRVRPLAPGRFQITFTASAETVELLDLARDLLRHALPDGEPAEVFARALRSLVADLVRSKFAATEHPRSSRGQADDSRNIPAEVKRAVFIRDRGRCTFEGKGGHRCGERGRLEFHHVKPYAAGGLPTVDNIELRCAVHNRYEADRFYGSTKEYLRITADTFSFRNENASTRTHS